MKEKGRTKTDMNNTSKFYVDLDLGELELDNGEKDEAISLNEPDEPKTRNGIIINANLVNVRTAPDLGSQILGMLNNGDEVTIIDQLNDFYKVSTKKCGEGFIYSKYIKEE